MQLKFLDLSILTQSNRRIIVCVSLLLRVLVSLGLPMALIYSGSWCYAEPSHTNLAFQQVFPRGDTVAQQIGGVHSIVQDRHGFMWFGGETGLGRYDGWRTKVFQAQEGKPNALVHGYVRKILFDGTGVMWVATERGLCRFREAQEDFDCSLSFTNNQSVPRNSIQALALDYTNQLFVGAADGLYRISQDRRRLDKIPLRDLAASALEVGQVVDLVVDHQGFVWVATKHNGLYMLSPDARSAKHFYFEGTQGSLNPFGIPFNHLKCLLVDSQNRLWIGSFGGGFSILNSERTDFQHFSHAEYAPHGLESGVIWDIFEDSQQQIWMLVDHSGLVHYDEQKKVFTGFTHKPYDSQSMPTNQLRTIFEDHNGDLWLGNFPAGVTFHNRATREIQNFRHQPDNPNSLSHSAVLSFAVDQHKVLWVGTENGLNRFNQDKGTFTRFQRHHNIGLEANAILSLAPKGEHQLWVGTWSGGLLEFDAKKGTFTRVTDVKSKFIWDILPAGGDPLLLGTEFNGITQLFTAIDRVDYVTHSSSGQSALPHNFVWDITRDHRGYYWVATQGGLAYLTPEFKPDPEFYDFLAQHPLLQQSLPISVYEDKLRNVWIGTQDSGAFEIRRQTNTVRHVHQDQGIPSKTVSAFIEDRQGELWFATTNGLARLDRVTGNIHVLKKENGLVGNNFNRKAVYLADDGKLYFGGANGLSVFNPERVFINLPDFRVKVTGLRVFNESVPVADDSPLTQSIVVGKKVEFTSRDTMFSFEFAAMNYRNTGSTRYAYQLEGFDDGWNYTRETPVATYTNIPAGNYTFRVRASRKNLWVEAEPIEVKINPSAWMSSVAWFIYFCLIVLAVFLGVKFWHLRLRAQIYKVLSTQDALTGLCNRLGLMQEIEARFSVPSIRDQLCLIFIDVDHFKRINDLRGHQVGDQILVDVANILSHSVRSADILGRWGGEEFLVICSNTSMRDAQSIAEKIRLAIAKHVFLVGQTPLKVTASFGVVKANPSEAFNQTFKRVDKALYEAKSAGRNCVISV